MDSQWTWLVRYLILNLHLIFFWYFVCCVGAHVSWASGLEPRTESGVFDQKEAEKRASPMGVRHVGRIVLVEHDNMHFSASRLANSVHTSGAEEDESQGQASYRQAEDMASHRPTSLQQRRKRLRKPKKIVSV